MSFTQRVRNGEEERRSEGVKSVYVMCLSLYVLEDGGALL